MRLQELLESLPKLGKEQKARQSWLTPDALAKTAGLSPFRVRSLLAQVNQFSITDLQSAFTSIAEADSRLKGFGGQAPVIVLDALVMSLCRGATEAWLA